MKTISALIAIGIFFVSCRTYKGILLSRFSYNGKYHNSMILDRRPQYGDTQPDGDVIEPQLELILNDLSNEIVKGSVREVGSKNSMANASIQILHQKANEYKMVATDSTGDFTFSRFPIVKQIAVSAPGYRTLKIDLTSKRLF